MEPVLTLEHVALVPKTPAISIAVYSGQSVALVGPGGSGKSRLLQVIGGAEKPKEGRVVIRGHVAIAHRVENTRKSTPSTLARGAPGSTNSRAAEALTALQLWDYRATPVAQLSPSRQSACELLEVFAGKADLMLVDGTLDLLDPWTLEGALRFLRQRMREGAALILATNRPELLSEFDSFIVLNGSRFRFSGSTADLLREFGVSELEVETSNPASAKAIADPFKVTMESTGRGLVFRTGEGQQLAARLLLQGYGDVKTVVLREPTTQEALLKLL